MKMENFEAMGDEIEVDLCYFAPELLSECQRDQDQAPDLTKSDIFSLGVTTYEFLMGKY